MVASLSPSSPAADAASPPVISGNPAAACRKSVLLLEDDPALSEIIETFLAGYDYDVVAVPTGAEGLHAVLARDFEAILCDMMMPTLSGDMFYRAIERISPHLCKRFVFVTGHQHDEKVNAFIQSVNGTIFTKPFALDELLDQIAFLELRELLAGPRTPSPSQRTDHPVAEPPGDLPASPPSQARLAAREPGPSTPKLADQSARQPCSEDAAVGQRGKRMATLLGEFARLALVVALVAVAASWYLDLRERAAASAAGVLGLEEKWAGVSQQLHEAEAARESAESQMDLLERLRADRHAPRWTTALRDVVMATGTDVELLDIRAGGQSDEPGSFELRIDGICTAQAPRATADQFRQVLEANLEQHFSRDEVATRFERLDEPQSYAAVSDKRKAVFTIIATAGSMPTAVEGSTP